MGLKRQLTLKNGIPLGIGSIMGSGILFLPSLTYSISNNNVAYVWIISTLFCLPLLVMFTEMVKKAPSSSGIEGFVSHGLGEAAGSSITLLLLSTVIIGMPSASIVAGRYVSYLFSGDPILKTAVAFGIVLFGVFTNLLNIKTGSIIQNLVTIFLIIFGISLVFLTFGEASKNYSSFVVMPEVSLIAPGLVAAFWAFAGFENLTFIAGEFKNPERDFKISMFVSIVVCGLLYFFLSLNFAALVDYEGIDVVTGLYQLAEKGSSSIYLKISLIAFAVLAVLINFVSWIHGISRLIYSSSRKGKFFSYYSKLDENGVPKRSIFLLAILFSISLIVDIFSPSFIEEALILVSTNFVIIYLVCIVSYIRTTDSKLKKSVAILLFTVLGLSTLTSGIKLIYGILVYVIGTIIYQTKKKKNIKEVVV